MIHELWYDDHTLIIAEVRGRDDSFDHEFGVEVRKGYDVESLSIIAYIGGIDYDVTDAFKEKDLKYFSEWVVDKVAAEESQMDGEAS